MYFSDHSSISYHNGPYDADEWSCPLIAIGWLEEPNSFPTGNVSEEITNTIEVMSKRAREIFAQLAFRGLYSCSFCPRGTEPIENSNICLFIPGKNLVYLIPACIVHYIKHHNYSPPIEFQEAVLACPEYGSPTYLKALSTANGENRIPIITFEEDNIAFQKLIERNHAKRKK